MSDDPHSEFALVQAEKLRVAKEIQAEAGAPWPSQPQPATVPQREDDETEEQFQARTAPPPGGYRVVMPKMTLQEAKAKLLQQQASKATSATSSSHSSTTTKATTVEPAWRAQVIEALRQQGLEPAPADYPSEAAFHTIPDIGIGLRLIENN